MNCPAHPSRDCAFISRGQFIDRSGKVGHVEIVQCERCGHGKTLPPLKDVAFLYEGRVSQDFQPGSRGLSRLIKDLAFRIDAKRLLELIGPDCGHILDFGCGSGQFTRVLGEMHGQAFVTGADMHPEPPIELADRAYLAPVAQQNRYEQFDVVIAMQVLEHDDDAAALLVKIINFAKPGGKVVIEVPNVACPWNRVFGKYWDAWYVPYHRQHFTRESLVCELERSGLRVIAAKPISIPTMGRSVANLLGVKNSLPLLLLGAALHPVQLLLEKLAGQPTAWRVLAIK